MRPGHSGSRAPASRSLPTSRCRRRGPPRFRWAARRCFPRLQRCGPGRSRHRHRRPCHRPSRRLHLRHHRPGLRHLLACRRHRRRPRAAALAGDDHARRNRRQVQRLADERAQRGDQRRGLDPPSGDHVLGGLRGETHLFLGAEEDHVRQRGLDRVADPSPALGAGRVRGFVAGTCRVAAQVAQVARVHAQFAGERTAEGFVGGDQRLQPLVDLAVLALAPALQGLHEHQADADRHQRHQHEPEQGREQAGPGTEIEETAHPPPPCSRAHDSAAARHGA